MKRAIFVRSKTIVMTELDKKIREKEIYRVTLVGSFVNFLLVIFKFLAGIAGHSAAMLADAVHSLSDFITDVVVIRTRSYCRCDSQFLYYAGFHQAAGSLPG